jgi:hypothetical protein
VNLPAALKTPRRKQREALRGLVAAGLLVVVKSHRDPLQAEYVMPDREGVEAALRELDDS